LTLGSYRIFARTRYEDPLELHGELEADDDDAASEAAMSSLGDGDWIEVQLVPEDAIRWVVAPARGGDESEKKTTARA
jgi:hypothetical protein